MKILLTHERFAPDFAGGGEYVVLETARHLIAKGHEVNILTTGDPLLTNYEGIPTTRIKKHRYLFNFESRRITEHARDVDIIQTFNYHACYPSLVAAQRLGKPIICSNLGLFGSVWREMRGPIIGRCFEALEKWQLRLPFDRLIFGSDFSRDLGLELGAPPDRSLVNNPGIDLDKYAPAPTKEESVLFVGKMEVRKGIETVLTIAASFPDVPFRIFGWGATDKLRASATPNVEFIPFERGEKLRSEFARARIFLFPSKAETFGIAIAEAMASGCAVISSIPVDFVGELIPADQTEAMIHALRRLLNDPAATERMGQENIKRAQKYNWDQHTKLLVDLYHELLDNKSSAGASNSMNRSKHNHL